MMVHKTNGVSHITRVKTIANVHAQAVSHIHVYCHSWLLPNAT